MTERKSRCGHGCALGPDRLWCHTPLGCAGLSPARMAWVQPQAPRTMNGQYSDARREGQVTMVLTSFQPPCSYKRPSWWVRSPWGKTGHKTVSRSWPLTCISSTTSKACRAHSSIGINLLIQTVNGWLRFGPGLDIFGSSVSPSLPPLLLSIYHLYWWFSNFQSATHSKESISHWQLQI